MELVDHLLETERWQDPIYIHVFSDVHRSAVGCDDVKLRSDINRLKHLNEKGERHWWIGGGDWSNAISVKDRRFDSAAVSPRFRDFLGDNLHGEEARVLAEEFRPIRDWGLGIGAGNHEDAVAKKDDFNPALDIAERLDLPYLGYSAILRLRLAAKSAKQNETVIVHWHHGRGAARSPGAKLGMLYAMRDIADADVYVVGHTHEIMDYSTVVLSVTRRGGLRLVKREVLFMNSGSYLKSYPVVKAQTGKFNPAHRVRPDYAEKAGFVPNIVGHNGFIIRRHHSGGARHHPEWTTRIEKFECR